MRPKAPSPSVEESKTKIGKTKIQNPFYSENGDPDKKFENQNRLN
jgi:hypothetical protein